MMYLYTCWKLTFFWVACMFVLCYTSDFTCFVFWLFPCVPPFPYSILLAGWLFKTACRKSCLVQIWNPLCLRFGWKGLLGGGFQCFLCSPLFGEMIHFDIYFSNELKPPVKIWKAWSDWDRFIHMFFLFFGNEGARWWLQVFVFLRNICTFQFSGKEHRLYDTG